MNNELFREFENVNLNEIDKRVFIVLVRIMKKMGWEEVLGDGMPKLVKLMD